MRKINKDYIYALIFLMLLLGVIYPRETPPELSVTLDTPYIQFDPLVNNGCERLNLTKIVGAKLDRELRPGQQFYYYICYTEIN